MENLIQLQDDIEGKIAQMRRGLGSVSIRQLESWSELIERVLGDVECIPDVDAESANVIIRQVLGLEPKFKVGQMVQSVGGLYTEERGLDAGLLVPAGSYGKIVDVDVFACSTEYYVDFGHLTTHTRSDNLTAV